MRTADDPGREVTNANREQYIQAALQYMLHRRTEGQVRAFRRGLLDVMKVRPPGTRGT